MMPHRPWGDVLPFGWNLVPARTIARPTETPVSAADGTVTVFRDGQVTLRRLRRTGGFTEALKEIGYHGIKAGELAIHSMDAFAGAMGIAEADGKVSPVVHTYSVDQDDVRYVNWQLKALAGTGYIQSLAKGIRERSTAFGPREFRRLPMLRPPLEVQESIADFLERETAQMDTLIAAQENLVRLLVVRRRAYISSLFSDENLTPLRRDLDLVTSGSRGWGQFYADVGERFIRITNLPRDGVDIDLSDIQHVNLPDGAEGLRTMTRPDDLLFSITAYLGSVAVVDSRSAGAFVSQHVGLVRLAGNIWLPEFVAWYVLSDDGQNKLAADAYGGTKVQISLEELRAFTVPVMPLKEQQRIIDNARRSSELSHRMIAAAQKSTELLRERRRAVIAAAVTGRLDPTTGIEVPATELELV